jgi:hypothetical protein
MIPLDLTQVVLLLLLALFTKHFIIDFPLQAPYQYLNKGTYGHPGGLLHSALHAVGTWMCLATLGLYTHIFAIALVDGIIHYHIDWSKVRINAHYGWGATTHSQFWILLGLDQFLHALTYIGIAAYVAFG